MSRLIDTALGRFRQVTDGCRKWFLFECPTCKELLPMNEEILAGRRPIDHNSAVFIDTICTFAGKRELGGALVSTMQSLLLMGYKPYHDEGQNLWGEFEVSYDPR